MSNGTNRFSDGCCERLIEDTLTDTYSPSLEGCRSCCCSSSTVEGSLHLSIFFFSTMLIQYCILAQWREAQELGRLGPGSSVSASTGAAEVTLNDIFQKPGLNIYQHHECLHQHHTHHEFFHKVLLQRTAELLIHSVHWEQTMLCNLCCVMVRITTNQCTSTHDGIQQKQHQHV